MRHAGEDFKVSFLHNVEMSNGNVFVGNGAWRDAEELLHSVGLL